MVSEAAIGSRAGRLGIIVRPVGDSCNLRCSYCYLRDKVRAPINVMPHSILEELIEQAAALSRNVQLLWHGGEPLLAGRVFFEAAIQMQSREMDVQFENFIQTNAILVDEDWTTFFRDAHFRVRVSLDGPELLNDRMRINGSNRGSYRSIRRSIERLIAAGVQVQISCVITEQSAGNIEEIYRHFQEIGVTGVSFLPAQHRNGGMILPSTLSATTYASVYNAIFDLWSSDASGLRVREMEAIVSSLVGKPHGDCTYSGNCAQIVRLEPSGDFFPCELHEDKAGASYGRLGDLTLADILARRFTGNVAALSARIKENVKDCPWYDVCHGGCYAARSSKVTNPKYFYCCEARSQVFRYIAAKLADRKGSQKRECANLISIQSNFR